MDDAIKGAVADEIADTCSCQTCAHLIEFVEVLLEAFFGETVPDVISEAVKEGLPIDIAQRGEVDKVCDILPQFQKGNVFERERGVGDNLLKLHTEGLYFRTDLHEVAPPIQCRMGLLQHHLADRPNLRHDLGRDKVVDAAVIVVLCPVTEESQISKGLAVKVLGGEDTGGSDLGSGIVVKDVLYLGLIIDLGNRFRTIRCGHSGNGLCIYVHTHILRSGCGDSESADEHEYGENLSHKLFQLL